MTREPAAQALRLCLATMSYAPFFGGAALRFSRYLPGFAARSIESDVFTSVPDRSDAAAGRALGTRLSPEPVAGVPVTRAVIPAERTRRRFGLYFRALFEHCGETQPDVVHLLNIHWLAVPWLLRLRRRGVRVVFSDTLIRSLPRGRLARLGARVSVTLPFLAVDAIVVSTSVMADTLRALGVRRRIETIANGVDVARFRPLRDADERAALRRRLGLPADAQVVLCVGAVERRKRVHLLLEAWLRHAGDRPDRHLVIVGPVSTRYERAGAGEGDPYHQELRQTAERSPAAERIHFPGEVDEVELYYRAADCFVLTSEREGMNNAVFEAMATAVPVVMVPFVGLAPAHGTPGRQFLLVEPEAAVLGEALHGLADDPAQRDALAEAGLAWAREHMDAERVMDRYAALYRDLLGDR